MAMKQIAAPREIFLFMNNFLLLVNEVPPLFSLSTSYAGGRRPMS